MRVVAKAVALGILLSLLVTGCKGSGQAGTFTGDYEMLMLDEAPAVLQRHFERQKAVPGLTVYSADGQTYLLLRAGRAEEPELGVKVLAVKSPVKGTDEVQIVAMVEPFPGETGAFPYALLVLQGGAGLTYKARLSVRSEVPLELPGIPLAEQ
ncbi:MAG TPA: hypothetical protein VD969_06550 [Symbiobacteriaceae bacterium]|nr:hypothetical protein [Symbiobacteriaceae bacterium]